MLSCVLDDHSRVILHGSDQPDSDYINANYIDVSTVVYIQCQSKKIPPPEVFWHFLTIGLESLVHILHAYYLFFSTLDYKFLFNYLQLWWCYAILSTTTQFTPYAQNVHYRPKHTLAFLDIFPKQLAISSSNITRLLYIPIYARVQSFIHAILSATTQRASECSVELIILFQQTTAPLL